LDFATGNVLTGSGSDTSNPPDPDILHTETMLPKMAFATYFVTEELTENIVYFSVFLQ
jgi:hypothetical protein